MTTAYRCRQLASMVRHGEVVRVAEVAELLEELARLHELPASGTVAHIHRMHHSDLVRLGIEAGHLGAGKEADQHRSLLLDVVRILTLENEELKK